jgi:hypothetical protein
MYSVDSGLKWPLLIWDNTIMLESYAGPRPARQR